MKRVRIDKSQLAIGVPVRIVDPAYRNSFRDSVCMASPNGIDICGAEACGAHMNDEGYSGMGQKVSDSEIWPLCDHHHKEQHANPGTSWWYHNVLKPMARRRYRRWKARQTTDPETDLEQRRYYD